MRLAAQLVVATSLVARTADADTSVLYLLVDDLRTSFGAYGHIDHGSTAVAPAFDKLARESTLFEQAYAQVAVCVPSRNSFMTGRRPRTTSVYNFGVGYSDFRARPDGHLWVTLPQYFKQHGYLVGGAGKTFHAGSPPDFDAPLSWSDELPYHFNKGGKGTGCSEGDVADAETEGGCEGGQECEADEEEAATPGLAWCEVSDFLLPDHEDSLTVQAGLRMLRQVTRQQERPFLLMVGMHKPHTPYNIPARFFRGYPMDQIVVAAHPTFPPNVTGLEYFGCQAVDAQYPLGIGAPLPASMQRALRRAYFAATAFADYNVGLLLDGLDQSGRAHETVVVMHSDHGYSLGEKNLWCKSTNFNMALKTPLMIRAPMLPGSAGQRSRAVVELVDLFPTVVELAGLPAHSPGGGEPPLDGTSFAKLLQRPETCPEGDQWACVKPAAFSQFARHRCVGDVHTNKCRDRKTGVDGEKATFMGYSVRTELWRYTLWVSFDAASDAFASDSNNIEGEADWSDEHGEELYDHRDDYARHVCGDDYDEEEPINLLPPPPPPPSGAVAGGGRGGRSFVRLSAEVAEARAAHKLMIYRHFAEAGKLSGLEARLARENTPPRRPRR